MVIYDPYNKKNSRIMYEFTPSKKLIALHEKFHMLYTQNNNSKEKINDIIEEIIEEKLKCYKPKDNIIINKKNNNKEKFSLTKFFLPPMCLSPGSS